MQTYVCRHCWASCWVLFGDAIFLDCIAFDLLINVTAALKPLASHFVALVTIEQERCA